MNLPEFENFIKNEVNWKEYGICPHNEQVYTVAVCKIINKVHMRRQDYVKCCRSI